MNALRSFVWSPSGFSRRRSRAPHQVPARLASRSTSAIRRLAPRSRNFAASTCQIVPVLVGTDVRSLSRPSRSVMSRRSTKPVATTSTSATMQQQLRDGLRHLRAPTRELLSSLKDATPELLRLALMTSPFAIRAELIAHGLAVDESGDRGWQVRADSAWPCRTGAVQSSVRERATAARGRNGPRPRGVDIGNRCHDDELYG